ncbi:MAG: XdhC family protein, partial [Hyphomicrobiales bacterium]
MSFDRDALIAACMAQGRVARVVVAAVKGSAPREVGAAMLVWPGGQSGTIGGGALEYQLAQAARDSLARGGDVFSAHALGPDMGQCCGGAVDILTEVFDLPRAQAVPDGVFARGPGAAPQGVTRMQARYRDRGAVPQPAMISGWMIEPIHSPQRALWVWGAGHVGRAIVQVLAPLP